MRKILIIILFICLFLCFICMYKENNLVDLKYRNVVQTNGNPVSSHIIVLDAGHGEPDGRCCFKKWCF